MPEFHQLIRFRAIPLITKVTSILALIIMKTRRKLRANGCLYGYVTRFSEDAHRYIFAVGNGTVLNNGKKHVFPKAIYTLTKTSRSYDLVSR